MGRGGKVVAALNTKVRQIFLPKTCLALRLMPRLRAMSDTRAVFARAGHLMLSVA